jgi:peptide/nickel transport system substrate-binding protein
VAELLGVDRAGCRPVTGHQHPRRPRADDVPEDRAERRGRTRPAEVLGGDEADTERRRDEGPSYNYFFVGFNCSSGPTADPKVRKATDYLLSMDSFVKHVVKPAGERQHGPLPTRLAEGWDMPVEEWKSVPYRKNVKQAKSLFKEAGVTKWTPKIAVPHNDRMRAKLAKGLVRGLNSAGYMKARTVKHHWEDFREQVTSGDNHTYDMYVGSWAGYPDPDTFLYPLFHQRMEGLTNGTYYRNPDVMDWIDRARETRDRKKRRDLYEKAITTVLEDRVHLPAFTLHNSFGVKDRVEGFRPPRSPR